MRANARGHNQVTGNAMTPFLGRLTSPAQIAAANELARAKGSLVADISRLGRAQFSVAGEEVLKRASRGRR